MRWRQQYSSITSVPSGSELQNDVYKNTK